MLHEEVKVLRRREGWRHARTEKDRAMVAGQHREPDLDPNLNEFSVYLGRGRHC